MEISVQAVDAENLQEALSGISGTDGKMRLNPVVQLPLPPPARVAHGGVDLGRLFGPEGIQVLILEGIGAAEFAEWFTVR
jgi:hypothetical protein